MSSNFWTESSAVFRKEWLQESRGRTGLMTSGLFSIVTVVSLAFATSSEKLSGGTVAGLLWIALLFGAIIALPRTFVGEEEAGTSDWLRLWGQPESIFVGKAMFNLVQMAANAFILGSCFVVLVRVSIVNPIQFILSLSLGCAALAGTVTLCGALVARAQHRAALAGAVSLPLLMPLIVLGVGASKTAMGAGVASLGLQSLIGLACYAVAAFAIGPVIYRSIWRD